MVDLNTYLDAVEVQPQDDGWVVRVTLDGNIDENHFDLESAARSYADSQRFRLSLLFLEKQPSLFGKKPAA